MFNACACTTNFVDGFLTPARKYVNVCKSVPLFDLCAEKTKTKTKTKSKKTMLFQDVKEGPIVWEEEADASRTFNDKRQPVGLRGYLPAQKTHTQ